MLQLGISLVGWMLWLPYRFELSMDREGQVLWTKKNIEESQCQIRSIRPGPKIFKTIKINE